MSELGSFLTMTFCKMCRNFHKLVCTMQETPKNIVFVPFNIEHIEF